MALRDKINEGFGNISETIDELKKSEIPLIMLGGGDRGYRLWKYLESNSIKVKTITVDKKYWSKGALLAHTNTELKIFEDEIEKYKKVNVVTGFALNQLDMSIISSRININKIYSINIGIFDNYLFSQDFFVKHYKDFNWLYNNVADDLSRELLVAHLNGRILGEYMDYPLASWNKPQYFLDDLVEWHEKEIVIDGGAYDGDTVREFISKMPEKIVKESKIYCFEPDELNCKKIAKSYDKNKVESCIVNVVNIGLWSSKAILKFKNMGDEMGSVTSEGDTEINVDSIDNYFKNTLDKITFIKMDIEGSELEALKGAKNTIYHNKPMLAICLYHKREDLITIPQYINKIVPEYKLFLRTHLSTPTELILLCKI